MANGAVALHLVPAPESKNAAVDKPDGEAATAIGIAVADAVTLFCEAALAQQEAGLLPQAIKDAGGSRIARISLLMLDHAGGDDDFVARAHRDGKRELHRYLGDTDVFRRYGPGEADAVLDMAIDSVFEIVSGVVRTERAYRAAWAN